MGILEKYFKIGDIIYLPHDEISIGNLNGCVHWNDGDIWWLKNGRFHRENGPAVIYPDGTKEWYLNDKLHREDGPAIICPDGYKEWYKNGIQYEKNQL